VISEEGPVVAACRYLDASVEQIELPLGLESRHLAAASVSQRLGAIAIVVSESGVVRVVHDGQLEGVLIPELWLLDRYHAELGRRDVGGQHRSLDVVKVKAVAVDGKRASVSPELGAIRVQRPMTYGPRLNSWPRQNRRVG
jgi:hypothetical protein